MKKFKVDFTNINLLSLIIFLLSILIFIFSIQPLLYTPDEAAQIVRRCGNVLDWRDCYGKQIAQANYRLKFPETLEILKQIQQIDNKTRDCHLISHRIATSEVDKSPKDWIKVFDYVDQTTCTNGFIHGVLEGRSKYDSSLMLNEKTIPEICSQIENRTAIRVGKAREGADDACAHITGHILLTQDDARTDIATDTCTKLPELLRKNCYDGVFMESITRENLEAHGVARGVVLNRAMSLELEENCRKYKGDIGRECWRELAHIYTVIARNNPNEVYALCYQHPNKDYAEECFMHSINLMILSDDYSHQDLVDTCKNYWGNTSQAKNCIFRSVEPLLGSSIDFIDRANDFCSSQPEQYKQFCYTGIGQEIKARISLMKGIFLCLKVPKEFLASCLLGN